MAFRPSPFAMARVLRNGPMRTRIRALDKSLAQASLGQADSTKAGSTNAVASSSKLLPHFKVPLPPPRTSSDGSDANLAPVDPSIDDGSIARLKRKYYIVKPSSGDWPVYSRVRNGGAWTTIIKGIKGDVEAFQRDVNEHFLSTHIDPLTRPSKAMVRQNTLHVYMKGHVVAQVKDWMTSQRL